VECGGQVGQSIFQLMKCKLRTRHRIVYRINVRCYSELLDQESDVSIREHCVYAEQNRLNWSATVRRSQLVVSQNAAAVLLERIDT